MNDIDNLGELLPDLSSDLGGLFKEYFDLITHYNNKINLVSKGTIKDAVVKHFADSYFGVTSFVDSIVSDDPIFDFGSGNGFPGMIGGMMMPNQKIILVERDLRKAEFLKIAANQMNLPNVEVHAGPLSDFNSGVVKYAMSRAMSPLPRYLLETREVMAVGGKSFVFKGDHWTRELSETPAQLFDYWDVALSNTYLLPDGETERYIIKCERL